MIEKQPLLEVRISFYKTTIKIKDIVKSIKDKPSLWKNRDPFILGQIRLQRGNVKIFTSRRFRLGKYETYTELIIGDESVDLDKVEMAEIYNVARSAVLSSVHNRYKESRIIDTQKRDRILRKANLLKVKSPNGNPTAK